MTNRELFTRVQQTVQVLANGTTEESELDFSGAQTTKVRYATVKNQRELDDCIEVFQEQLQEKAEDYDTDPQEALQWVDAYLFPGRDADIDIPEDLQEEVRDLLDEEVPFEPYHISESDLMKEPDIPVPVLDMVDDLFVNGEA